MKKLDHIPWFLITDVDETTGVVTTLGTHPGTHSGQLVLLTGRLANNVDYGAAVWLHVATYAGEGVLTLITGRKMKIKPYTTVAMPVQLFSSLTSPAWYGYMFKETVR